jgi:hypothetical protein
MPIDFYKDIHWESEYAWLNLGDISKITLPSYPLIEGRTEWDLKNPGKFELRVLSQSNYLTTAAKLFLGIELLPIQSAILEELWYRPFPMYIGCRGFGKSWLLAVYALLRCLLIPGTKIVIVGGAFRQSKIIFEYMENILQSSPILKSVASNQKIVHRDVDRCTITLFDSWAIAIPIGDGTKIRGLRAHTIIADEFDSLSPDIYETVIIGFTSVTATPVHNVKQIAKRGALAKSGIPMKADIDDNTGNQAIISGTAGYEFKHMCQYWKKYKAIIESKGKKEVLEDILCDEVPENFDWRDYSVIRIPEDIVPKGFLDARQIARAKATIHSGIYKMEYGACFSADSKGFFKRSLIESCVASETDPIMLPSGDIWFDARLRGHKDYMYVYGIDPASEQDNFSIVILELHEDHSRIVYCWSTNRHDFQRRLKSGFIRMHDFYGYCARKIRDLMRVFPTENIAIDAQGGGVSVEEALHDPDKMEHGEVALWPIIDSDKEAPTDLEPGAHMLHMCQFAKADWTRNANHGMRKDFEDKVLLFPRFDSVTLGLANDYDVRRHKEFKAKFPDKTYNEYDTLEDCVMEIEALKDELCTIVVTRTGTGVGGRDRWDTPEVKLPDGKKGRLRKDRYSALLMANMVARQVQRAPLPLEYQVIGGFASDIDIKQRGQLYQGPEWFTESVGEGEGFGLIKR